MSWIQSPGLKSRHHMSATAGVLVLLVGSAVCSQHSDFAASTQTLQPALRLSWCRLDSESFVAIKGGPNKNKKQLEKAAGGRERASLLRVRLCEVFARLLL